jgi:mono/diheme cytochrome c family protein
MQEEKGERTSFLKKRSKKLLVAVADFPLARAKRSKSFLVLFFKKEHSSLLTLLLLAGPAHAADPPGAAIFNERCALCHQPDAHGAPGVAPSLAGTLARYATTTDGKKYLSQIVLSGMVGKIPTEGHTFSGLMPSFAPDFSDEQIAAVVDYVLAKYNGVEKPVIAAADVAAARAQNPVATQTRHLREKILGAKP